MMTISKRIGDILIEAGLIDQHKLTQGLERQMQWGGKVGDELINLGYITEVQLATAIQKQKGTKEFPLGEIDIPFNAIELVPFEVALKYNIIPVSIDRDTLTIATVKIGDKNLINLLGAILKKKIKLVFSDKVEIKNKILECYKHKMDDVKNLMQSNAYSNDFKYYPAAWDNEPVKKNFYEFRLEALERLLIAKGLIEEDELEDFIANL